METRAGEEGSSGMGEPTSKNLWTNKFCTSIKIRSTKSLSSVDAPLPLDLEILCRNVYRQVNYTCILLS